MADRSAPPGPQPPGRDRSQRPGPTRDPHADRDRGISDLVGFIITFSLVVLMVGVVYAGGVTQLQSLMEYQKVSNTEQGFQAFAENVEDLNRNGVPSRTTTIDLHGGTIDVGDPTTINVSVVGTGEWYRATVHPVVYRADGGASIAYVNGMVVRVPDEGRPTVVEAPPMVLGNRTVIPLIQTRPGPQSNLAGDATVQIRTTLAGRRVYGTHTANESYEVNVTVTSPRSEAWLSYFREQGATCSRSGDVVSCTVESSSVRVTLVRIDVRVY